MIEWKGLFANTPYSSANNKTQDDAVVGMQDTIYVTGPGYGSYSANVRVHNASGAVVALIPVSGGGGALSAPAPVRILDDSTTYSYSLEVVRGVVPSDDADKIVIRIIGGASKRYPGQGSTLADGSTSFAGSMRVEGALSTLSAGKGAWGWKIVGGSNYAGAADDQTASTISTSRRVHRNEGGNAITRIAFVYANAIPNGTSVSETDLSGLGDITASAYFENADGTTQLPIAGAATAVIKPGRVMITDPMDVYIAPGERFWARSVASKLSAVKIPVTGLNYQAYEGIALGSDIGANTGMTGFTSSTGSGVWAPVAVIGWTDGDYVEVIGDSITKGTGDSAGPLVPTDLQGVTGWVRRWLYGQANYIVAGYPGGSLSQWNNALNTPSLRRWLARITPPTTMIIAFGANDLMPNPTLATMQAAYTRAVAEARARGVLRVGIAEILPRTTTSDSWATQSPASASFAAGGLRDLLNAWFHSSGLFDFVLPTNSAVATGAVWTNPGASGDTSDGCHPLTAGAIKIAASMPDVSEIFA